MRDPDDPIPHHQNRDDPISEHPSSDASFSDEELLRYSRHLLLPQVEIAGQLKLRAAHALIIGAGGLGCPVGLYLASAGIGQITVVDADQVELSNLQRQIAHTTDRIGVNKATSLQRAMQAQNPLCQVTVHDGWCTEQNADALIAACDIVIDCCDNFATRYLINRFSVKHRKPLVSGAAIRGEGQVAVFNLNAESPCYACLYPDGVEEGETCAQAGVLSPLVGVIGSLQAVQAINMLLGNEKAAAQRLTVYDAFAGQFRQLGLAKDPDCAVCHKTA